MKANYLKHRFLFFFAILMLLTTTLKAEEWPFTLNCPKDVTVSCHDELWNLSIYGNATYTEGYKTYSAGTPTVKYYLNSCNSGYITRTWMVEDNMWRWHSCTQTIHVSPGSASGPYIRWPQDYEVSGCNPPTSPGSLPSGYNYPEWDNTGCGMYGKSYTDMLFTVNGQCKKVMRTWKVMDWCNASSTYGNTLYTHVQFIYIVNNVPPVLNCPGDITIESANCKNAYLSASNLTVGTGYCNTEFEITNNSPYALAKGNNISGTYPIGTTKVAYSIRYGCGKTYYCYTNVTVKNGSKPVPYCLGYLITTLMGVDTDKDGKVDNGMVEIWAKDLDKGSHSLCGHTPLRFSFSKDVNDMSKTFTCDQVGKNEVPIWVTDSKGAQNFCLVEIDIQNNGANIPNCKPKPVSPPPPPITPTNTVRRLKGNVSTITDKSLEKVEINLVYKDPLISYKVKYDTVETLLLDSFINASGYKLYRYNYGKKINETKDSSLTYITALAKSGSDGKYSFDTTALVNKPAYISAAYSDSLYRFIDQKDIILLKKFLDGEVVFSSYHQYLASDIDEDGDIDQNDLSLLTDFVDRKIETLPGSHQWYLLNAAAVFSSPADVLKGNLPERILLDSITANTKEVNFIALKKGNISVDAGSLKDGDLFTEVRNRKDIQLKVDIRPNPYSDKVLLSAFHPDGGKGSFSLFDVSGKEIYRNQIEVTKNNWETVIDLSSMPTGILYYRLVLLDNVSTGKLVHLK